MVEPAPAKVEPEVGVVINDADICTWTSDVDEKRRAFVVSQMANCDLDGKVLVQNMHAVCDWLRSGRLPEKIERVVPRIV
jgi:hypothetical protein